MQLQQHVRSQDRMPLVSCTRLLARACRHVLPAPAAATRGIQQHVSRQCAAARLPFCSTPPIQGLHLAAGLAHSAGAWQGRLPSAVCAASTSAGRPSSSRSGGGANSSSRSSRRTDHTAQETSSHGRPPPPAKQRDAQQRQAAPSRQPPGPRTRRGQPTTAPPPPAAADWWEVEENTPSSSGSSSRQAAGSSSSATTPLTTSSPRPSSSRAQAGGRSGPQPAQPAFTPSPTPAPVPQAPTTSTTTTSSSSSSSSSSSGRPLPVPLSDAQVSSMRSFLDFLLDTNTVMNLTSVRDPQEAWERHVGDSLALLPLLDELAGAGAGRTQPPGSSRSSSSAGGRGGQQAGGVRLLDVGTGPGLPGMILALARPQWQVVLMDSLKKRTTFLERAVAHLGVTNVTVVWGRAETLARKPALRESFHLVTARAVAELPVLAELCLPFVAPGGAWVAAKGADIQAELDAARPAITICSGRLRRVSPVDSWSPLGQRTAVVVDKVGPISTILPRRPGTPGTTPLTAKDSYKYRYRPPGQSRRR